MALTTHCEPVRIWFSLWNQHCHPNLSRQAPRCGQAPPGAADYRRKKALRDAGWTIQARPLAGVSYGMARQWIGMARKREAYLAQSYAVLMANP